MSVAHDNQSGPQDEAKMTVSFTNSRDSARGLSAARQTNDFVHFVVHKAANAGGLPCEMCAGLEALEYVPFVFTGLLTELQALR